MKKLMIIATMAMAAFACNAATVNWKVTAGNMYASNGTDKYTGVFALYVTGGDLSSDLLVYTKDAVVNGTIANQAFSTVDTLTVGTAYDFYFVLTDGSLTFTSSVLTGKTAAETGATLVNFGSMQSATQNPANWVGGGEPAPEPTSGLLMLLGMAGLALRRRRA